MAPGGATETVKCIIPQVSPGTITRAAADEASTLVADAAIMYAESKNTNLSQT